MKAAPPNPTSANRAARMNTLIVDGNPNTLALLGDVLAGLALGKVHRAARSDAAMAVLRAGGVDVVFVDIEAPNQNGLEFVRQIREAPEPAIAAVVVVVVSAQATAVRVMEAGVSGANSFLCKPYSVSALIKCVNEGYANRRWTQGEGPAGLESTVVDA